MNVFKEMALSVYSYGSYSQFLKNKKGKVFGFGILLVLIYFLAVYLIPSAIDLGSPNGLVKNFREEVPDFELKNGTLWVEEPFEADTATSFVKVNTEQGFSFSELEIAQYFNKYRQVILMDSQKVYAKNSDGQVTRIFFSDLDWEFNRRDVEQFLPWIYVGYAASMIFVYIWITALFFFGVLFVALLGMIAASCMKYKISSGQLYLLAVYSRTLPLLIKALVSFLPFNIPFFWVINFGLSLFIMIMALRKMKEQPPERPSEFTPSGFNM